MTNRDLASTLFNIATLLKDAGENPYRVRAYERGARALMRHRAKDFTTPLRQSDKTLPHPKYVLGDKIQAKLRELTQTGEMAFYDELLESLPAPVVSLMRVPGIGPRTAARLHETLGLTSAPDLATAARAGRLTSVWGIGPKRQAEFSQLSLFDDAEALSRAA